MNGRNAPSKAPMKYLPIPKLKRGKRSPAQLKYIVLTKDQNGEAVLLFYILRDLSVRLRNFTLAYRFSAAPVTVPDGNSRFYTLNYDRPELNAHEYIICKMRLSPTEPFRGCGAFVSAVMYEDGRVEKFSLADYYYAEEEGRAPVPNGRDNRQPAPDPYRRPVRGGDYLEAYEDEDEYEDDDYYDDDDEYEPSLFSKIRKYGLLGLALLLVIGLVVLGVSYMQYQVAMSEAKELYSTGDYRAAQSYVDGKLGKYNSFYNSHRDGMAETIEQLCEEGRYNEAYRIVINTPFADLMQQVCRQGAEASLAKGDFKTAYEYAYSAPDGFGQEIVEKAAAYVFGTDGSINEDAYAVTLKTEDTGVLDELLVTVLDYGMKHEQYVVAMRAVLKLSDPSLGAYTASQVFDVAVRSYVEADEFDRAASYISAYRHLLPSGGEIDDDLEKALIEYYNKNANKDVYSTLFLARQFGMDAGDITVRAEDSDVRRDLNSFYFILTPEQMRSYHQRTVAVDSLCLTLKNGSVGGVNDRFLAGKKDKSVCSVYTGTFYSVLLYKDGTVSLHVNSTCGNSVIKITADEQKLIDQVAALTKVVSVDIGEEHIVFLHEDGSVTAIGDNSYGQCDVSGWNKIVAVAAGSRYTVGLRSNGTLVACGSNAAGQCDVDGLNNVVDVRACAMTTVVLFSDGTAGVVGERSAGLIEVDKLTDIKRIRAGASAVLAEKTDGKYVLCGGTVENGSYGSVNSWSKMSDFDCGRVVIAGLDTRGSLKKDGANQSK